MRSKSIIGVVLCFGLAFAVLSGSGIGAAVFAENPDSAETTRTLEEISDSADVDEESEDSGLSADVVGDNEPSIVGIALSAGQFGVSLVGAVALLPLTLVRLGFPAYFAVPAGGILQIVALIGLAQFVIGREWL